MGLNICPSSEDFVITADFDQLGHHELPLVGGLYHVQRTSTS
jgi:hypothetical protein